MGQELGFDGPAGVFPLSDRFAEMGGIPSADRLRERGVKLALGRALYDPGDPMGKMFFNILATFAEFEADLIRMRTPRGHGHRPRQREIARQAAQTVRPDSSGNSAACMPPASIPSAISPSSSPSQDQPSIAHSTGATPLSVRPCPPPESTRNSPCATKFCQCVTSGRRCNIGREGRVRATGIAQLG